MSGSAVPYSTIPIAMAPLPDAAPEDSGKSDPTSVGRPGEPRPLATPSSDRPLRGLSNGNSGSAENGMAATDRAAIPPRLPTNRSNSPRLAA